MTQQRRVRAVDVARVAGVSAKTVSNVVNGYPHVSHQVRERVTAAIRALDYVPNISGRVLRTGRTGIFALALPDLAAPYFAELAREIAAAADLQGYTVLVDQTSGEVDRERRLARGLRLLAVDGLIFSPLAVTPNEIAEAAGGTPTVLLGEREHPEGPDRIAIDNVAAARAATEHLIALGRRRIAFVGDAMDAEQSTGSLRATGFRQAMTAAGLTVDEDLVVRSPRLRREHGIQAAERLLSLADPPDGLFCCNDLMALGAIHVARSRGVTVPGDLAVVGFDDIEEGRYATPSLTTIAPDKVAIARNAVDLLIRRLATERPEPGTQISPPWQLIIRRSTDPCAD